MRKLVTIREVGDSLPIQGKDRIELTLVDGWSVITKKAEFSKGDLCVFFEIDSFIPEEDVRFSFLEKSKTTFQKTKGYRIKTMKMSGAISQGLTLPIGHFQELSESKLGDDVTDKLKVIKYDNQVAQDTNQPRFAAGDSQGKFPNFIPKTDQERIQNLPHYFKTLKEHLFEETLKLDGSSLTAFNVERELSLFEKLKVFLGFKVEASRFGVCSRNLEVKRGDNFSKTFNNDGKASTYRQSDFWKVVEKYGIEQKLPVGYALQGELVGPSIQSNHEKVSDLEFYVFDIFDIVQQRYLSPSERHNMMSERLQGVLHVPVVNKEVDIFSECDTLGSLLERVEGESINPQTISEGRVYKSMDGKVSFKCISNRYLLKCEN